MKAVILAGGLGTRLSEATHLIPKPMVEIGGKPILWHIMKTYSHYGINEFVICLGYKSYIIKEWFANYFLHSSDVTIDLWDNSIEIHDNHSDHWKVTLIDTGLHTMTAGRVKKIQKYIGEETFLLTYGDGVGDIDIHKSIEHHRKSRRYLTVTAYKPQGKFGSLEMDEKGNVTSFTEKPKGDGMWINAGYFVCEPEFFDYLDGDNMMLEKKPLETLAKENQMTSYIHDGFWKPMDTLKDNNELNDMWNSGNAPWKLWD
ncbi:glucose-1-phosphate cytidylyltransferase [uncultured Ilyobacter sp.]|uniref:glucose-1-phosphate cytidylyltransferase n=1 Tax=uncultured Ilyobacter sp. TaxID=544433 RepID=UPI0029F52905|nr:glucose-1-phosphate cytidylyltransferase [uncultured Ilyobacter sp.]